MVTEPEWEILMVGFVDALAVARHLSDIDHGEPPFSPQPLSKLSAPHNPLHSPRHATTADWASDEAVWTETATLFDAVKTVYSLYPKWPAALAQAVTVHHAWTAQSQSLWNL